MRNRKIKRWYGINGMEKLQSSVPTTHFVVWIVVIKFIRDITYIYFIVIQNLCFDR